MKKILIALFTVMISPGITLAISDQGTQNQVQVQEKKISQAQAQNQNKDQNTNSNQNRNQNQNQKSNGDCDNDGIINSKDQDNDETMTDCQEYKNRNRWQGDYNPRSDNARQHMSIVAKAVENLLAAADRMEDPGIGEEVREIARQHGQTAGEVIENEDLMADRSGVLKFFIGPDFATLDETKQLIEQMRNQVQELNQIRTRLQNEGDQTELQNQIQILELQLSIFQNYVNQEEQAFSLFGWLAKLFN
jgi:hypothetical protein